MLNLVYAVVIILIAYFLWFKVIMMYYKYWFYKQQEIATFGFPLPLLGNLLAYKKV